MLTCAGVQCTYQSPEHLPDIRAAPEDRAAFLVVQKPYPGRQEQMRLQLFQRTLSHSEKLDEVRAALPAMTLGNVGRNRRGRTADLGDDTKHLHLWKSLRQLITFNRQIHSLLPNIQIPVRLDGWLLRGRSVRGSIRITMAVAHFSLLATRYTRFAIPLIHNSKFTRAQICFWRSRTPSKCSRIKFSMFAWLK